MNQYLYRPTPSYDYIIQNFNELRSDNKENISYYKSYYPNLGEYTGSVNLNSNFIFKNMYNDYIHIDISKIQSGLHYIDDNIKMYIQLNIEECHTKPNFFVENEKLLEKIISDGFESFNAHVIIVASSLDIKRIRL